MNFAIVENGIVTNVVVSNQPLDTNWVQIPSSMVVDIGDRCENFAFYDPNGNLRMMEETITTYNRVIRLEDDEILKTAQIKALADRNDFLEDCIAEIACVVYA